MGDGGARRRTIRWVFHRSKRRPQRDRLNRRKRPSVQGPPGDTLLRGSERDSRPGDALARARSGWGGGEGGGVWDLGFPTRDRPPKLARATGGARFAAVPADDEALRLRFSIVVCTYNGGRTISSCLRNLMSLDYPDYEVIVV